MNNTLKDYKKALRNCVKIDADIASLKDAHFELHTAIKSRTLRNAEMAQQMKLLQDKRKELLQKRRKNYYDCEGLRRWFFTDWASLLSADYAVYALEKTEEAFEKTSYIKKKREKDND